MSAAEKLRVLERVSRDMRFHPENAREARENVLRALPQILAVVEATEREVNWHDNLYDLAERTGGDLGRALAALQEHLEQQ